MTVLLATTTVLVYPELEYTEDAHGHRHPTGADGFTGPYDANIQEGGGKELDFDGTNVEFTHTGMIDPSAWPVGVTARLLDGAGNFYHVVYANLVADPAPTAGVDATCVKVALQRVERERIR